MVRHVIFILILMHGSAYALPDISGYLPIIISSKRATIFASKRKKNMACLVYHGAVHITLGKNLVITTQKARVIACQSDQGWQCTGVILIGDVKIISKKNNTFGCTSCCSRAFLDLKSFSFTIIGTNKMPVTSTVTISH